MAYRRDKATRQWHALRVTLWNKDDIIDFAYELDRSRDARLSQKQLSEKCRQFLCDYMECCLSDEQVEFFERELMSLAIGHMREMYEE